jgi:hypothetical protein
MTEPAHAGEYRYSPRVGTGPCPTHPGCLVTRCDRFGCGQLLHRLGQRGQPRRFCCPACRVAEHRRLNH